MLSIEKSIQGLLLLGSAIALWVATSYGGDYRAGPDLAPMIWLGLIALSLFFLLILPQKIKRKREWPRHKALFFVQLVLMAGFLFLINEIGYFIATFLFLIVFFWTIRAFKIGLVVSVIWTVFSFFLFYQFLGVQLPINPIFESWLY